MGLTIAAGGPLDRHEQSVHETIFAQARKYTDRRFLYIVPEQGSMQAEHELLLAAPDHVLGNVEVVTFTGLASQVREELEDYPAALLDDIGKAMICRKIAEQHKSSLTTMQRSLGKNGFAQILVSAVSEFSMAGLRGEVFENVIHSLKGHNQLINKMNDIHLIYSEFTRALGAEYTTAEELLWTLAGSIPSSRALEGVTVVLYGFNSFKMYQYAVIKQLLFMAREVICVLTADPNRPDLFVMESGTIRELEKLSGEVAAMQEHDERFKERKKVSPKPNILWGTYEKGEKPTVPELRYIAKTYADPLPRPWKEEINHLKLVRAVNPGEEVHFVLQEILRLVREEGYSYSDLAVLSGDLSVYRSLFEAEFSAAGIPFFIDEKKRLQQNPLAEFVEQLLDCLKEDMGETEIMSLLRNPLFPLEIEKVDRLELYLLASSHYGLDGWGNPWTWKPSDMPEAMFEDINESRQFIYELLLPLRKLFAFKNEQHTVLVSEAVELLAHFLIDLKAEEKMEGWRGTFEAKGDFVRESEYRQAYRKVMDLLNQTWQLMGKEQLEPRVFAETLRSGFEGLKVGMIPGTFDRVVVGDLERTRLAAVKVLFVVGGNEGVLTRQADTGGILNDYDRTVLKTAGMSLFMTAREETAINDEYIYLTFTKPQNQLVVSYSETGRNGKELRISSALRKLQRLFPGLAAVPAADLFPGLAGLTGREDGFRLLIMGLRNYIDRKPGDWWEELYRFYLSDPEYRERTLALTEALLYAWHKKTLTSETAVQLFMHEGELPVTRLEAYASCPYRHFLESGLGLKPRRENTLNAADFGTVFHEALDLFFRKLSKEKRDFRGLSEAERHRLAQECVHEAVSESDNQAFTSSYRSQLTVDKLIRMTETTLKALQEQWEAGGYDIIRTETEFSEAKGTAFRIPVEQGRSVSLRGRIDRIDIASDDERIYVKIIDYKSGSTQFSLPKIYYGLQLQLLLYLESVLQAEETRHPGSEVIPAGFYYYNIQDPYVDAKKTMEEEEKERRKTLQMNGLTNINPAAVSLLNGDGDGVVKKIGTTGSIGANAKQIRSLAAHVRRITAELVKKMADGEIDAVPAVFDGASGCEYCENRAACRHDTAFEGCSERRMEKDDNDSIWKKIEEEINNGDLMDDTAESNH